MGMFAGGILFLIPVMGVIGLFTFLAVVGWAEQRRREREAYYRYEFRKKLVEAGKMDATQVHELMRFEYESNLWRRRQGMIAGGFILAGVGVGILFGLQFVGDDVWMVGFIPAFMGLAMILYAVFVAPKSAPMPPSEAFSRGIDGS